MIQNLAIAISLVSLIISVLSYLINRRKANFDTLAFKREYYAGVEKLHELLNTVSSLKSIEHPISQTDLRENINLFPKFFDFYKLHEDKIIKADYKIISNISSIKKNVTQLEETFELIKSKSSRINYIHRMQSLLYQHVLLELFVLSFSLNDNNKEHKKYELDQRQFFENLYDKFQATQVNNADLDA